MIEIIKAVGGCVVIGVLLVFIINYTRYVNELVKDSKLDRLIRQDRDVQDEKLLGCCKETGGDEKDE